MDANDPQENRPQEGTPGGEGPQAPPPGPEGTPTEPMAEAPGPPPPPPPRRLLRSRESRVIGGVCGGLGRYFNVDPILFRIAAVALVLFGGAGVLIYAAGLLLLPSGDPGDAAAASNAQPDGRRRALTVAGVVLLLLVTWPFLLGGGFLVAGLLVPIAALAIAGVLVWWLVSGEGPSGDAPDIARRAALGVGVLFLCGLLAVGGAWAAAAGGGSIVAGLVIVAGLAILAGAFARPARWLILPAVVLAVSAGTVGAAGIVLDGGVGERDYRPTSASELRDRYELGMGEMDLDLTSVDLPPGDTAVEIDLGVGEARLTVPEDVCVAVDARVGIGESRVLGVGNEGVDVEVDDRPDAPARTSRLLIDADVGMGSLRVRDESDPSFRDGDSGLGDDGNRACLEAENG